MSGAGGLEPAARAAVRNAASVAAQRSFDLLRSVAFAALVPRLLGPADFGRFALVSSIAVWFALLSGLGSTQLFSRFVPDMALRGERDKLRRLLGNILTARVLSGTLAALACFSLTALWLRDFPVAVLALVAFSVVARTTANVPFAFFLGLNEAARWGAGETARRWLGLLLVAGGAALAGLGGACAGMALTELAVLALGILWARPHLALDDLRLDRQFLAPYFRYNLLFFASNLLFAVSQHGGESLIRSASGDYVQVGYFGVAMAAYLLAAHGAWQVLMSFVPLLAGFRAQGRPDRALEWTGQMLKLLSIAGVAGVFAAALLGEGLVTLIVGVAFAPAAALLVPMSMTLGAFSFACVARLTALTLDRPGLAFATAVLQASILVVLGIRLVPSHGALGAALALLGATGVYAMAFVWGVRRVAPFPLRPAFGAAAVGLAFLPLAWVRGGLVWNAVLLVLFVAGYAMALVRLRLVSADELVALRSTLAPGRG